MPDLPPDSADTLDLLGRLRQGDREALGPLLQRCRPRMQALVEVRLDPALRARVDPSDVVQEAQMEMVSRIDDFLERRPMPFHLWARKTAYERVLNLHRDHKRACRSVAKEVGWPQQSSTLLARALLSRGPTPSQQAEVAELAGRISALLAELPEADREVLLLRHTGQMPYDEIACLLGIEAAAARKRYGRALIRLQTLLSDGGLLEN